MKRKEKEFIFNRNLSKAEKKAFPKVIEDTRQHEYHGSKSDFCDGDTAKYAQ